MLIVGENLNQITKSHPICDNALVEGFCLKVKLGRYYYTPKVDVQEHIVYGNYQDPKSLFSERLNIVQNLQLGPNERVISCSADIYDMPLDHFGLIQTKGTLARMFVQATCGDGQIEPGFKGYITLEIINFSPWTIQIPRSIEVAQLYLFKASTEVEKGYNGRYAKDALEGPTLPIFI